MRSLHIGIAPIGALLVLAGSLSGCGSKSVSGKTYEASGGGATVEFQSGGTAKVAIAGQSQDCKYTEDLPKVSITCPGDATPIALTLSDDGTLSPPANSVLAGMKLTEKK